MLLQKGQQAVIMVVYFVSVDPGKEGNKTSLVVFSILAGKGKTCLQSELLQRYSGMLSRPNENSFDFELVFFDSSSLDSFTEFFDHCFV